MYTGSLTAPDVAHLNPFVYLAFAPDKGNLGSEWMTAIDGHLSTYEWQRADWQSRTIEAIMGFV